MEFTCKQQRISIFLLIISFFLLGISFIITWMNPATKYEASIYLSTPKIYWASLLISLFVGFFIVIKFNFTDERKIYKNTGLFLLFLAFASFLSLWIVKGYYMWCSGDPMSHFGWINDILLTGHFEKENIYPITHIFVTQICHIININPIIPYKYIPLHFGLLYLIFMYLFAKAVLPNKRMTIFVLLVAVIPMGGWFINLTPNHLSNLTLPLAFFILFQYIDNKKYEWCILFLVMCFLFPIFHIVPSIALLIMIFTLTVPVLTLTEKVAKKYFKFNLTFNKKTSLVVTIVLFVWIITWISSFYVWDQVIRSIYILLTEGAPTQLDKLVDDISYAKSSGYSVIKQFLKVYGGKIIYLVLTAIGCIGLWKNIKKDEMTRASYLTLLVLTIPLIIVVFLMGILYFVNIFAFGPSRLEIYPIMISTLFVGYALFEYIKNGKCLRREIFVSVFLVFLFVIAGLKIYPSPYVLSANWQITRTEMNGMDLLLRTKDKIPITSLSIGPKRYADALFAKDERSNVKVNLEVSEELKIPFHFGYDESINLGDHYGENIYMVLTYRDRILYKEVFPEVEHLRFTDDDFDNLEKDDSLIKFYENGGCDSYYIHSYWDEINV